MMTLEEEWDFSNHEERMLMIADGRCPNSIRERIVSRTAALLALDAGEKREAQRESATLLGEMTLSLMERLRDG